MTGRLRVICEQSLRTPRWRLSYSASSGERLRSFSNPGSSPGELTEESVGSTAGALLVADIRPGFSIPGPVVSLPKHSTDRSGRVRAGSEFVTVLAQDPWDPIRLPSSTGSHIVKPADGWFDVVELPEFDPEARRTAWITDP
jgi:hypothetical protein